MDAGVDLPMVAFGVNPIGTSDIKAVVGSVVQRLTDWTGRRRLAERIAGIEGPAPSGRVIRPKQLQLLKEVVPRLSRVPGSKEGRLAALNSGGLLPKTGQYPWRVYVSRSRPRRRSQAVTRIVLGYPPKPRIANA